MSTQTYRSFLACPIEDAISPTLAMMTRALVEQLPESLQQKFFPERQHHITLRFLGDVDQGQLYNIIHSKALDRAAMIDPVSINLGKIGVFPSWAEPSVLHYAIGGDELDIALLNGLQLAVDQVATEMGFPAADYVFNPHITIGRFRGLESGDAPDVAAATERLPDLQYVKGKVREIGLYYSYRHPFEGARYELLFKLPLGVGAKQYYSAAADWVKPAVVSQEG